MFISKAIGRAVAVHPSEVKAIFVNIIHATRIFIISKSFSSYICCNLYDGILLKLNLTCTSFSYIVTSSLSISLAKTYFHQYFQRLSSSVLLWSHHNLWISPVAKPYSFMLCCIVDSSMFLNHFSL